MFTVVIPLFNKSRYITRAIESILAQKLAPAEIIVVDDGSTDGGANLISQQFPTVTLIRQENAGAGAARNAGLSAAKTEWSALLDADDFWTPDHLYELKRIIDTHPDVDLVSTQFQEVTHGTTSKVRNPAPGRIHKINFFDESSRRMGIVCSSSAAVRKTVMQDVGGFGTTKTGEDTEFWARLALTKKVAISDAQTAFYVRGVDGITETLAALQQKKKSTKISARSAIESHPACKTVIAALDRSGLAVSKKSLLLYLNAWRVNLIRQALVRGDTKYARELAKLINGPTRPAWYGTIALTFIPAKLMQKGFLIRKTLNALLSFNKK